MAVDEGLRDTYLRRLRDEIEARRHRLGRVREQLRLVRLEDQAQAGLDPAVVQVLIAAEILDGTTADAVRAERDKLVTEVDALQALIDAVRGLG